MCQDLLSTWLQVVAGELELNHECNSVNWSPEDFESKLQVTLYNIDKLCIFLTKQNYRALILVWLFLLNWNFKLVYLFYDFWSLFELQLPGSNETDLPESSQSSNWFWLSEREPWVSIFPICATFCQSVFPFLSPTVLNFAWSSRD